MSAFVEFCLVALALFAWESLLWIPLRGVVLRVSGRGKTLRVKCPDQWFATKNSGCVFLHWWPGSGAVLPTQALPLLVNSQGRWLLQQNDGRYVRIAAPTWDEIRWQSPTLQVGKARVRLTSSRCLQVLWQGKKAGLSPAEALRKAWAESLSPSRAAAERKKWHIAAAPLRWMQPLLLMGFVAGLCLFVTQGDRFPLGLFLLWIFLVMVMIAGHVWWLGKKIYTSNKSDLMTDVFLCCLVPFHAMRAAEAVARHAMGGVHPFALLLRYAPANPWLLRELRQICHPRPGNIEEEVRYDAMKSLLQNLLSQRGLAWSDFHQAPTHREPGEVRYCPRCHALYLEGASHCRDCGNYPLQDC